MLGRYAIRYKQEDRGYSTPCLIWQGALSKGYAYIANPLYNKGAEPKYVRAHRYFWIAKNGPIPDGLVLNHLCKQRACVNLDHLEVITQAANVRKGNLALINEDIARSIKIDLRDSGMTHAKIAEKYMIDKSIVDNISRGTHWKGVSI